MLSTVINFWKGGLFLLLAFAWGCGSEDVVDVPEPAPEEPRRAEGSRSPVPVQEPPPVDLTPVEVDDRTAADIMLAFHRPAGDLPVIETNQTRLGGDGLLYTGGVEGPPFTGKVRELFADGRPSFESTYLNGNLHGRQLRWHENGYLAVDALFEEGRIVGVKRRWWPDGRKREEEYWSNGRFRGRRLWDEDGQLMREELVNF